MSTRKGMSRNDGGISANIKIKTDIYADLSERLRTGHHIHDPEVAEANRKEHSASTDHGLEIIL